MSYPDTLSRLEGQVRQLEDARMQEARERDSLRSEANRLRRALHDASLNLTVLIEAAKSAGKPGLAESVSKFRAEIDAALS